MKLKRNIAISDSGFVFNPSTGDSFSTNPIGGEIIRMLQEQREMAEIKGLVLESYQTDEATFEKDYYDFIKLLEQYKLVQADEQA